MSNRIPRANALIKKELSKILFQEIDFPPRVLVTITRVETLANLISAKIYISVIPENKAEEVLRILDKDIYNLQQQLNKRLKMRPVPKIGLKKEEKAKEAARIEEVLEQLKKS